MNILLNFVGEYFAAYIAKYLGKYFAEYLAKYLVKYIAGYLAEYLVKCLTEYRVEYLSEYLAKYLPNILPYSAKFCHIVSPSNKPPLRFYASSLTNCKQTMVQIQSTFFHLPLSDVRINPLKKREA